MRAIRRHCGKPKLRLCACRPLHPSVRSFRCRRRMYGVSKLAVAAYGRLLSKELEGKGISVSVVHPGYVATDMSSWNGELPASEGADSVTWLALAAKTTVPSGKFWYKRAEWGY